MTASAPVDDVEPAVEVADLVHDFGRTRALSGVTFTVGRGEIFALLGPNGAGKTTTMRILLTLLRATAGRARVDGIDVAADGEAVRRSVGWVPQDRATDPLLTARENLTLAAGLYHLDPATGRRRAGELLELVGLAAHAERLVRDFSGGMRRRLELAMGLVHVPSVLFLDEPTLGLDISARRLLWEHVSRIRRGGTTVLLTTHYLEEADALCDRVAIIDAGRIRAVGTPAALKRRYGRATVHLRFDRPPPGVADRLAPHPRIHRVTARGGELAVTTDDPVAAADAALAACRRQQATPDDLWIQRASLDDVFLSLTGHGILAAPSDRPGGRP